MFSIFQSQNDLEKQAQLKDKLIPAMDPTLRYNAIVALNEAYVVEIMSIPRVGQFMYLMLKKTDFEKEDDINDSK